MSKKLPYLPNYGLISKVLEKIKVAATPPRFTQDFLTTKLGLKAGHNVIPFLKRAGFIGGDAVPTELYRRFRNPSESAYARAQALRNAYQPLYESNEYAHELNDHDLKGLIVQITGLEPKNRVVQYTLSSFKALKASAQFDGLKGTIEESVGDHKQQEDEEEQIEFPERTAHKFGISYTINLNLPGTSDITVFNAIFKSLKEHLLR